MENFSAYTLPLTEIQPLKEIDSSETQPLSDEEKEMVAEKRLKYLKARYPPQKPLNKTKKMGKVEDHEKYIKDLLS